MILSKKKQDDTRAEAGVMEIDSGKPMYYLKVYRRIFQNLPYSERWEFSGIPEVSAARLESVGDLPDHTLMQYT